MILVLKHKEERLLSAKDEAEIRPLLILLRNADNALELARRNDNTVLCIDCGGVWGDSYEGITIKDGYFFR